MHILKQLSTRYLTDAKKLGYTWYDLLNKATRQTVIDKVNRYKAKKGEKAINKAINKALNDAIHEGHIQQMVDEVKREPIRIINEYRIRQMEDEVKRENKRLTRQHKLRTKIEQVNTALQGYTKSFKIGIKTR